MNQYFIHYFEKFLNQLKTEILAYEDEKKLWVTAGDIKNSGGNLCYHLLGNINHYVGVGLAQNGYQRDRPLEFSIKDVPRRELVQWIEDTMEMTKRVFSETGDLEAPYPQHLFDQEGSRAFFMFRILNHLSYHLGQINYHRRLIGG